MLNEVIQGMGRPNLIKYTKERPGEDTARKQPSIGQLKRPQNK